VQNGASLSFASYGFILAVLGLRSKESRGK
jgi:hypothetical protein